jgi:hypothetical protein
MSFEELSPEERAARIAQASEVAKYLSAHMEVSE